MSQQLLLNLLGSRNVVMHLDSLRNLIVLVIVSEFRGEILIVTIGASLNFQTLAIVTRHHHHIIGLCRKITVMVLVWYSWM